MWIFGFQAGLLLLSTLVNAQEQLLGGVPNEKVALRQTE